MRAARSALRTDREGAVLVYVALGMVVFLGFAAFTIDLGMAYTAKAEAQRYADAMALAGASAYLDFANNTDPMLEPEAISRVREYQALNAVRGETLPDEDVAITVDTAQERVTVVVTRNQLRTYFAGVLGIDEMTVRALATAEAAPAPSSDCVKPFAVPDRWEENSPEDENGNGVMDQNNGENLDETGALEPDGLYEDWDEDEVMDFDNTIPCSGSGCDGNEIWTFEDGVDSYRPMNDMEGESAYPADNATSWGSTWKDPTDRDAGARILITPQSAQGTGTPGWYQYWKMPGSSGASDLTEAIAGCLDLGESGVGDMVEADPQTGNIGNPVYEAISQLWDPASGGDPDIEWNEAEKTPWYPGDPDRSIWDSPRVFQVLLVHPADIQSGSSGTLRVADIATVFLEQPTDPEWYGDQGNQSFKLPIFGRLLKYGSGSGGGSESSSLQKILRLVE